MAKTQITAKPGVPQILMTREFEAPSDLIFRAHNDPELLAWAANERRVILTHDVTTLRQFAEHRVRAGLPMPGVFEIGAHLLIREVIEDLLLIADCSHDGEWEGQVRFLPLR